MLSQKLLELIDEEDLQSLVRDNVNELKTLEFKSYLNVNSDNDKKEFLFDVSSFANANGGDLIYGIREYKGQAGELEGIEIENVDAEVLRLENIIRDGIEPRIPRLEIKSIPLANGKVVFILRIGKSWSSPHWVKFKGSYKFYSRNSAGKYLLDLSELRSSFNLYDSKIDRLRSFRSDRLSKIISGDTPCPLDGTAKIVLHILPLNAYDPGFAIDIRQPKGRIDWWAPLDAYGFSRIQYNFDGLFTNSKLNSYLQLFRNGCIETVNVSLLNDSNGQRLLYGGPFEKQIIEILSQMINILKHYSINPPIFIMLSLLGIKGYDIATDGGLGRRIDRREFIQSDLLPSEVMIDNLNFNSAEVMKPIFDVIWNAAGWPGSPYYDEQGNWHMQ